MSEERARLVIEDRVGHLQLCRPAAGNAIDRQMAEEIGAAVDAIHGDSRIRSVLISGEGNHFCVGGDLKYLTSRLATLADEFRILIGAWHTTLPRLLELPFPVVTAVHGGTAGGGLGLVWCADFVIAADTTKIATGFAELGLSGDGGSTWHLPRLVGLRRAQEMILDNRVLDAKTALDWGLVNEVVPRDELMTVARARAEKLASRSITASRHQKALIRGSTATLYAEHLQGELRAMVDCAEKNDVQIGMPAFVNKVKPVFTDEA